MGGLSLYLILWVILAWILKKVDTLEKRYRLKKNGAFTFVYKRGKSASARDLVMLYARGKSRGIKVGFSVSKKVGNAVTRNLVKRRLRECFRPHLGDVKNGMYIIVARPSAAKATFQSLYKQTMDLLGKQHVLREGDIRCDQGTEKGNRAT